MRRPLRKRVWFYKPDPSYLRPDGGFYLPKWWWVPFSRGGDEFNWHTVVLGNPVIGCIVIAVRPCPKTGECAEFVEECPEAFLHEWPVDAYGHDHVGVCLNIDCYCWD